MKKLVLFIFSILILSISSILFAAPIYVDNQITADSVNNYDPLTGRGDAAVGSGIFDCYKTIQSAVAAMEGGDDIFIRGGTYNEGVAIRGKSGTLEDYSSMQSYPGEWAIIDGNQDMKQNAVIVQEWAAAQYALNYWRFERLEITDSGGAYLDHSSGIYFKAGSHHVDIRYCYVHNILATSNNNLPAGIHANIPHHFKIEFCHLENNGSVNATNANSANITFVADYRDSIPNDFDPLNCERENIIRYNLLIGSGAGYRLKNQQIFGEEDRDPTDMTYLSYGDDIHHNIVIDPAQNGIYQDQDFSRVHHNILVNCGIYAHKAGDTPRMYNLSTYNNTVMHGNLEYGEDPNDHGNVNPFWYSVNNIISKYTTGEFYPVNIMRYGNNTGVIDMSTSTIERNYIYATTESGTYAGDVRITLNVTGGGPIPLDEFDTRYSFTNYKSGETPSNPLFIGTTGASQYKTSGTHVVEGTITINNGGIGGTHPYHTGVSLPSYVGATNPGDNEWVDGVLGLNDNNVLKTGSIGDPAWVEGNKKHTLSPVILLLLQ